LARRIGDQFRAFFHSFGFFLDLSRKLQKGGRLTLRRAKQLGPCHLAPVACPGALSMECNTSNFEFSQFSRHHKLELQKLAQFTAPRNNSGLIELFEGLPDKSSE
jgi:hypothetical protein